MNLTQIGRYEVIQPIGQGGMGAVYLARDPMLDREVAIKILRDEFESEELRARFLVEARAVARLQHRYVVSIFEIGEHQGRPFIVMEYLAGETLAQIIGNRAVLSLSHKLMLMQALCSGLSYLHGQGVVHRDIKPANVMVKADGELKILDFGIARVAKSSLTESGMVLGTLNYISPEQLAGQRVDQRTDVFSTGAVFYELLSYQQPFPGDIQTGVLQRIMTGRVEPLLAVCPGLPAAVDAIVMRCLQIDPDRRYQDLAEAGADIERCRTKLDRAEMEATVSMPAPMAAPPSDAALASALAMNPTLVGQPTMPGQTSIAMPPAADATLYLQPPSALKQALEDLPDVHLIVTRSDDARLTGRAFKVSRTPFEIGRADCLLTLPDVRWSRRHAVIEYDAEGFSIRDLESTNGTYVNGRRVAGDPERLFFGASVRIGSTVLTFSSGTDTTLPDLTDCDVTDRYRLESLVRDGAHGAMYIGRDARVPRRVAIKLLSPALVRFAGYRGRFEHEAMTAATLQHPHICQVLDHGSADVRARQGTVIRTQFICFTLMQGGNLADRLDRDEALPIERIDRWVESLGDALDYCHQSGIVHGNVKPSSVVFDTNDNAYLTDFAIAQKLLSASGRPMGTPSYMAPEQWDGTALTPATDQFALAAVAYYMIGGVRPFEGQDNPEVRQRNFQRGPAPVHVEAARKGRPGVSPEMSAVLERGLAADPGLRFASATAFAQALARARREPGRRAAPKVFFSYQRESSAGFADLFQAKIQDQEGIDIYLDTTRRDGTGPFPARLAKIIQDCDVFVCFLAGSTLASRYVREEIRLAHQAGKPMIPVFHEDFNPAPVEPDQDPAVEALIAYEGVHLLSRRNIHVDHTISDLAHLIINTFASRGKSDS